MSSLNNTYVSIVGLEELLGRLLVLHSIERGAEYAATLQERMVKDEIRLE